MKKGTNRRGSARPRQKFRRILVPMDFSGLSRQAFICAVPLARQHRSRINLIHVVQPPVVLPPFPAPGLVMPVNTARLVGAAKRRLDKLAARFLPLELRGQTVVREGNPALGVVSAARTLKADLIVLSTTGRSGLSRALLGSTAERIVRHAHCPVLTVRRRRGAAPMPARSWKAPGYPPRLPWRRILVPLDFSLASLRALRVAVPLSAESGARLLLLHVVEPDPYPVGLEGAVLMTVGSASGQNTGRLLQRVARRFVPNSTRVTSLVGRGRAGRVIVSTAEAKGVDLIVLSTHGHTGLNRLLIGSTAEQVVRRATCPVFVARIPRPRT